MGHPVAEPPESPSNPGGHHPGLQFKQEGCLNNRLVECSGGPGVIPLPPKNHGELRLLPPGLYHIVNHHRTVFFRRIQDPTQIFIVGHHLQRPLIFLKGCCYDCVRLLLYHPSALFIHDLGAHCRVRVSLIEQLPLDKPAVPLL